MTSSISNYFQNSVSNCIYFDSSGSNKQSSLGSINSSSDEDILKAVKNLLKTEQENYAKSFDKSSEESDKKKAFKRVVSMLMANADKDNNGLSKQELSEFDTSKLSSDDIKIVNNIISNFDNYDINHDGLLSFKELEKPLPNKEFSLQELGAIAKSMSKEDDQSENNLLNMSASFTEKILENYSDSELPQFVSTVVSSA